MNSKISITIDFPPKFAVRWGRGKAPAEHIERLLIASEPQQRAFLPVIHRHTAAFERIDIHQTSDRAPFWDQVWFPPLDGMSLYAMIAHYRPRHYVEIGSGNSTKFARRAIDDQSAQTNITSIDPFPRAEIDLISDRVLREGLESVDLTLFDELDAGDVVLFDGSHRSFMNSDVTVFFIDVLPRLRPGVIVGVHDIFWPEDYPAHWLERHYNEQYLLGTYLLGAGGRVPILFACNWMGRARADAVTAPLSQSLVARVREANKSFAGGCFWFAVPEPTMP